MLRSRTLRFLLFSLCHLFCPDSCFTHYATYCFFCVSLNEFFSNENEQALYVLLCIFHFVFYDDGEQVQDDGVADCSVINIILQIMQGYATDLKRS